MKEQQLASHHSQTFPFMMEDPQKQSRIKEFTKMLKEVQRQNHCLQYLENLVKVSPIVPLDECNEYGAVSIKRYEEMFCELEKSRNLLAKLERDVYENRLRDQKLQEQVERSSQENRYLKENQCMLSNFISELKQTVEDQRVEIDQKHFNNIAFSSEIQRLKEENTYLVKSNAELTKHSNQTQVDKKKTAEIGIQTQYEIPQIIIERKVADSGIVANQMNVDQSDKVSQKVLLEVVQQRLQNLCQELDRQLQIIREQQLELTTLKSENIRLISQNEQLKQKLEDMDLKKEQLKVWRSRVNEFVEKIEGSLQQESPHKPNLSADIIESEEKSQSIQKLHAEIAKLQTKNIQLHTKIAEMKLKFKTIENLMIPEEDIIDDGPVNNLVKLTHRIKAIVKGLLYDSM